MPLVLVGNVVKMLPKLEPGFFKETAKKSSWQVTGLRNRGPLKDLNDSKLIVNECCNSPDWKLNQFFLGHSLVSYRKPTLVPVLEPSLQSKTVTWKQTLRSVDDTTITLNSYEE